MSWLRIDYSLLDEYIVTTSSACMYFSQCNLHQNKKRVALAKGRIISRIKWLRPLIFENFYILDMLIWSIRLPLLRGNDQKLHAITATMVTLISINSAGKDWSRINHIWCRRTKENEGRKATATKGKNQSKTSIQHAERDECLLKKKKKQVTHDKFVDNNTRQLQSVCAPKG